MDNWKEKTEFDKRKGEEVFSSCINCVKRTRHKVLASVEVEGTCDAHPFRLGNETIHGEVWTSDSYQIVRCGGCDFISFRHSSYFSEDTEVQPAGNEFDEYAMVEVPAERIHTYPKRVLRREIDDKHLFPAIIREIHQETRSSLANREHILGGMGIRALVELVAKDRGAKGANLAEKISSLVQKGLLTAAKGEFLHILRDMGNESAHQGKGHSESELSTAMDIVEHLLEDVYILPVKAQGLPTKRLATN